MSDPTTTQTDVRVQTHKYDECAVCGQPMDKVIETVVGGSVDNNAATKQAKTCYEPVDPDTGQPARVRLFFHLPGDPGEGEQDGRVQLDQVVNHDES
jgi:hypothetical protein